MAKSNDQSSEQNLIELGEYIENLILQKIGNNFNEASRFIGISSAELFALRKGERKNPNPKILSLIAEKLNGDYSHMMKLSGYVSTVNEEAVEIIKPALDHILNDAAFIQTLSKSLEMSEHELQETLKNMSTADLLKFVTNNGVRIRFKENSDGTEDIQLNYSSQYDPNSSEMSKFNEMGTPYIANRKKLPIVGVVTAGPNGPAYAEYLGEEWTDEEDICNGTKYYWLQVKGNSMTGEGIMSGDLALIREQSDVESGELAIVIVNGEEGTLKRVYKKEGSIVLQSANAAYPPRIFSGKELDNIRIAGKVKVTKRKY